MSPMSSRNRHRMIMHLTRLLRQRWLPVPGLLACARVGPALRRAALGQVGTSGVHLSPACSGLANRLAQPPSLRSKGPGGRVAVGE